MYIIDANDAAPPPVNPTSSPLSTATIHPLWLPLFLLPTRRPHPSPRVPNARSTHLYGADDPRHSVTSRGQTLTRSEAAQQNWTPLAGTGSRPTRSHVRRITRSSIDSDPNQMFALDIEHFQCALGALTHLVLDMYPDITSTVAVLCRPRSQPRGRAPLCPRSPHPTSSQNGRLQAGFTTLEPMVGTSYPGMSYSQGAPSLWVSSSTAVSPFPGLWSSRSRGRTPSHGIERHVPELQQKPVPC